MELTCNANIELRLVPLLILVRPLPVPSFDLYPLHFELFREAVTPQSRSPSVSDEESAAARAKLQDMQERFASVVAENVSETRVLSRTPEAIFTFDVFDAARHVLSCRRWRLMRRSRRARL